MGQRAGLYGSGKLGGPQGRSVRERKVSTPPGFSFVFCLHFIRTSFFVLIVVHFAFTYNTQHKHPFFRRDFLCSRFFLSFYSFDPLCAFISSVLVSLISLNTQHKHLCPQWVSNPPSQKAVGLRPLGHWNRPTGIRYPARPVCSQSLYRLRYSGPPVMPEPTGYEGCMKPGAEIEELEKQQVLLPVRGSNSDSPLVCC